MLGKKLFLLVAIMKAGVTGATLGLAMFGAMDIAFAIAGSDWLAAFREEYAVNILTVGGGLAGVVLQLIFGARTNVIPGKAQGL